MNFMLNTKIYVNILFAFLPKILTKIFLATWGYNIYYKLNRFQEKKWVILFVK